ncbi:MAG: hypothetical protein ACYC2H_04945 [Thermoplasmatota archaeon]
MVLQKAVKSYPMVKWFLIVSAVLVVMGLVMSKVLSDPDHADSTTLLMFLGAAVVLPFLAMLFPRRKVLSMEVPTDHLAGMSKTELEGVLSQLDAAKAKGEMDDTRYAKARERILAAIKAKKKA